MLVKIVELETEKEIYLKLFFLRSSNYREGKKICRGIKNKHEIQRYQNGFLSQTSIQAPDDGEDNARTGEVLNYRNKM